MAKDQVIRIVLTSERRLTGEELRQATSLVTGTSFDGLTPVFVNGREVARVQITSQGARPTEIRFSKHCKLTFRYSRKNATAYRMDSIDYARICNAPPSH